MRALLFVVLANGACDAYGASPPPSSTDLASLATGAGASAPSALETTAASPAVDESACTPSCSPIELCADGRCQPKCPAGEVYVPPTSATGFTMGAGEQTQQYMKGMRLPPGVTAFDAQHRVVLSQAFCMDANEVSARDYAACISAGACSRTKLAKWSTVSRFPDKPVNNVDWKQARNYCQHVGKDLPTEAQWEWAARGDDGRVFPWGNEHPTCEYADFTPGVLETPAADTGCNGGNASPVGVHPKGDRVWPAGHIHDLAGNVWEWTLDNAAAYPTAELSRDPLLLTDVDRAHVVRGGGWNRSEVGIRSTYRGSAVVGYQRPGLGFRCVRNSR